MAYYWIKLYHEVLDDPKMATLPDRLWRRCIELFLLAGRTEHAGDLPDARQIAWSLRIPVDELLGDLEQIISTGIIEPIPNGYTVVNFAKRQGPNSDQERKFQQRTREKSQQYKGNVTNPSRNVTQNRTEQNRVEEDAPQLPPLERPNIFSVYENEIGILTPTLAETLQDAERIFPAGWVEDAIKEAALNNKRSWKYVDAILKRWNLEGKGSTKKKKSSRPVPVGF